MQTFRTMAGSQRRELRSLWKASGLVILVGESIPPLERCSVVGSSSKRYHSEDPFLSIHH